MKNFLKFLTIVFMALSITSCNEDDDFVNREHHSSLFGEWVSTSGNYYHDYYHFYSDGTGIHGSYEPRIDLVHEDDDITWYTVDNKYLYIDGSSYSYECDGSSLRIGNKSYYEK